MFEKDFESMLRRYGDAVEDKKKFTGLIKDFFPQEARTINLMLMAYEIGIVQQIQSTGRINSAFAYRFVKQLTDDYGLSRVNADWVVSVWCVCYGKNILGKECEIGIQSGKAPAIAPEQPSTKKYGDLFHYRNSMQGQGLAVCGFSGDTSHTVIFQNRNAGKPVIEVGEGLFENKGIEEVIITEGYQYIGKRAFFQNERLHQVVMPYTLLEIGDSAFEGCGNLKRITLTERLERIGSASFKNTGLKTIVFPKSVYYIGSEAFAGCTEMDKIKIPANIDHIADGMFEGCTQLKKIDFSESLREIGERAFKGCSALDIITIPDSVEKIGETAFDGTNKMFIIQCSFGTYAEQYARSHRFKYQLI